MPKIGIVFLVVLLICSIFLQTTYPLGLASPENITVTGRFQCWDNSENIQPVVWARVLIYDLEPGDVLDYLGYATTDTNGYFTSDPIPNNDGPGEDGLDIVVCITAWNPGIAVVIDPDGYIYSGLTSVYSNCSDSPPPLDIGTWRVPYNVRGAWMIFSYHNGLVAGWNYIHTQTGYEMVMSTARWPFESWPHFHTSDNASTPFDDTGEIHLPNWAAWYPDIIFHEYAHHVMYTLYGYLPPTLPEHYINETSDASTAWVEGWADFFPLAVQNDPVLTGWNLETPHWCSSGWDDGGEVEGRVAGALWDIFDSINDGYDNMTDGLHRIWNITRYEKPDTFREFWDAWNATYYTHPKDPSSPYDQQDWTSTLMAIFQNSIDYRGLGDVNADSKVDLKDVNLVAAHFGNDKKNPEYPWDDRRDINHDDTVDLKDYFTVSVNYGKTYDC